MQPPSVAAATRAGSRAETGSSPRWRLVPLLTLVLLAAGFLGLGIAEAW
jgi:hypothetical protein